MKTHELEKLILPRRLSCCLCQLKNDIEAVSKTIKLHCETACEGFTFCDEELSTAKAALLDAVRSHRESTSTELTIEPEKTSPKTLGNILSNFGRLLKKLLKQEEQVEVPKEEWETGQLVNANTNAQDEEEEQESSEMKTELPSYLLNKKLIVVIPISVAAMMFILLLCLILICHRFTKGREGSSRSSPESEMEAGSVWSRRPLGLKNVYRPLTTIWKKNMAQRLHDESSDEDESPDKIDEGELTEVRIEGSESAAEDTGKTWLSHFSIPCPAAASPDPAEGRVCAARRPPAQLAPNPHVTMHRVADLLGLTARSGNPAGEAPPETLQGPAGLFGLANSQPRTISMPVHPFGVIKKASRGYDPTGDILENWHKLRFLIPFVILGSSFWNDPETGISGQLTWARLPQGFKNSPTFFDKALHQDLLAFHQEHPECTLLQYVEDLLLAAETEQETSLRISRGNWILQGVDPYICRDSQAFILLYSRNPRVNLDSYGTRSF
ncbi:uncharacterized protein [Saccopteryx leptura]|uniref:uncharacterized protein n=1 Tax=Saccopteryx leptura TaxID=249018 RepID=UPI00339BDC75